MHARRGDSLDKDAPDVPDDCSGVSMHQQQPAMVALREGCHADNLSRGVHILSADCTSKQNVRNGLDSRTKSSISEL